MAERLEHIRQDGLTQRFEIRFRRPLMSFFLRRVSNHADAEDLTQDVFVRLAGSGDRDRLKDADAFVFKIASNLLKDRGRRAMTRGRAQLSEIDHNLVSVITHEFLEDRTPERILQGRNDITQALEILDELGERTKDIYLLFRLEDMKQRDIAELYGTSVKSVEKQIMKATVHLARRLKSPGQ